MYQENITRVEEIKAIGATPMTFILGKERSGTTLLQVMLNAHPNIIAPPESRFIILLYYKYGKTQQWTEKLISNFCNDLFKEGLFRNFWGINKKELQSVLETAKDLLTFPLICKIVFRLSSPSKKEIHIYFDKNPVYYFFLPELKHIFPDAKYIHLIRDYRAYLASYRRVFANRKREYSLTNPKEIVYRWMKVNMLIDGAKKLSPEKYYTLKYEALVQEPSHNMERICHFLNLPFDEAMVKNHLSGMYTKFNDNTTERFREIHQEVFRPINPALSADWKEKITGNELVNIEDIAGEYGETGYGYKRTCPDERSNTLWLLFMKLKYGIVRFFFRKVYSNLSLYYVVKRRVWANF